MSEEESSLTNSIMSSIEATSGVTNWMKTSISSLPVSVFFLSFLNWFTMCSLYVLLNFPLPEQVYQILAFLYEELNSDFLALIGVKATIPPLGNKEVSSLKAEFFGVTSDVFSSNVPVFVFFIGNVTFIVFLNFLTAQLKEKNYLRTVVSNNKREMIHGQVINLLAPLVLPWTFVMLETGVRNVRNKLATMVAILVFFMGVIFPFVYFFELLQEKEDELVR